MVCAENDPMDYVAAPSGTHLAILYYNHYSANESYSNGKEVSDDANMEMNLGIFRGVYYTKVFGFTENFQFLLPFADLTLDGAAFGDSELSTSGLGDLILTSTFWFIDNPESKTWLGFTPFLYIPTGDYDDDHLSIGENRWKIRPEIGFAKGFGKWNLDLTTSITFFGDNDDYGNVTMEQDPEFHAEAHLTYKMTDTFNTTVSWFHHRNGETTVDGVDQDDEMDDHAIGVAFACWLTPQYQLIVKYRRDIEIENGLKTNMVGLRFLHAF